MHAQLSTKISRFTYMHVPGNQNIPKLTYRKLRITSKWTYTNPTQWIPPGTVMIGLNGGGGPTADFANHFFEKKTSNQEMRLPNLSPTERETTTKQPLWGPPPLIFFPCVYARTTLYFRQFSGPTNIMQ